jgi:Cu2+-exporting ATPase
VATGRLFRNGIFLKDGAALERLGDVDTIVFDKTGTLTDGHPTLATGPVQNAPAWRIACALASASKHPFSQAISAEAQRLGIQPAVIQAITEHPGDGMSGLTPQGKARLGRPEWINNSVDGDVLLELPDGTIHAFTFSEVLRPGAAETCDRLRSLGYELHLLSGDGPEAVSRVAKQCGIVSANARLTPPEKYDYIAKLRQDRRKALMIGDGLNDSPALAAAHASMSPATAMDATQSVADLVFTARDLRSILIALRIARTARRRAFESFGIAAIYNLIAIPLAFAGFVVPLVAALAMSGSSILVIVNALRLRRAT